ncbi:hypothetical protein CHU98_g4272 [Xylaria longipes]|nr:hypothetical protein CHU98_g4272 [Xylaria longipes]
MTRKIVYSVALGVFVCTTALTLTSLLTTHWVTYSVTASTGSGFLLSFATIVELATLVSFLVVLAGGKFKREGGWKLIGGFLLADAVVEFASMGIVAWLFENDSQFVVPGWALDYSFYLCTTSASVSVVLAAVLAASAYVLPPEDDYESLEDPFDS